MTKVTIQTNLDKDIWFLLPTIAVSVEDKDILIALFCFSIGIKFRKHIK